ncbi:MAG: NAD(P)-dependent oxidoreductase [Gammaproteobacteria bacterium]|nr:NAD(P)-dependent oxidoreductase [Gammaproteobacteria bacterium]
MKTILITGNRGLVGRHLQAELHKIGFRVRGYDIEDGSGDITDTDKLRSALKGVDGVVHLAAVSRVVWGERDPIKCWQLNAIASESLLKQAIESPSKPWVLVASSREVYGEQHTLPVSEDVVLEPVNVYGRAKLHMEKSALEARTAGLNTAVVRLANVYGCPLDHHDRVLPAFCRNAAMGDHLRVDGFEHLFDFTHVTDTVAGISRLIQLLDAGERSIPPIHLLPGIGTTLRQAAEIAVTEARSKSPIIEATSRSYDVCRFIGNPERARALLGWQAQITPEQGIRQLVNAFMSIDSREAVL